MLYNEFVGYGFPSALITFNTFNTDKSCKPIINLFHGGGLEIKRDRGIFISQGFNLTIAVFSPGLVNFD